MSFIIGLLIAFYAAYQIYDGTTLMYHKREDLDTINFDVVNRKDHPVYFWIVTVILLVISAILLTKIVQF